MGAACDTICSRKESLNQTQPDTESMKIRSNESSESITSIQIPLQHEGDSENSLIEEFMQSVIQGNNTMVMFYLSEYPSMNLLDTKFKNNVSCLQLAVQNRRYDIIELILKANASV